MVQDYSIRPMSRRELDVAVGWAADEGWNPGLHDADAFYAADPAGFLMGFLDGKPVSCISAVAYDTSFGFIGFYIVRPEHRGKGLGIRIWNEAMARLAGRNIGLDGVVEQQANYMKSGFTLAYRNVRYEGRTNRGQGRDRELKTFRDIALADLLDYDSSVFGRSRLHFLQRWVTLPGSTMLAIPHDQGLRGYGVIRQCRIGYKIGPLFADDADLGARLFRALQATVPEGQPLFLDVPEVNQAATDLAKANGMAPSFETARMYTQEAPATPLHKVFGVTTFELG